MDLLERFKERVRTQSRSVFAQQYQGLYLYCELPGSEAMSFRTRVANASTPSVLDLMQRAREHPQGERVLLRVEKSDRNSWKRRISVGRATNNDLILRHESVSKLHAHFTIRAGDGEEQLVLSDVGSANGTLVNGRAAGESLEEALPVEPGDRVLFGEVECEMLDAARVYDKVVRLLDATGDF